MKSRVPFHRVPTFPALALALLALAHSAIGANIADNFLTSAPSAGSLVNSAYWSLGALPTVANDATFPFGSATGIRTLSANNLTMGSFDNLASSGTMSLRSETATATDSILTLGGAGNLGNASAGANSSDLLFVATGGTLNLTGPNGGSGSGALKLLLGQSGNFNAAGTLGVSAVIGETSSYGLTKTGAGTLTLNSSAANTFTGGLTVNGGTLTEDFANVGAAADLINGANTLALGGGILNVKGNSANNSNQTLGNVTVSAGGGQILVNPNGASRTATLTLGMISATTSGGTLLVGKASASSGTATITTGSAPDPITGIYGGRCVWFNGTANTGYDWASSATGAPYAISALGSYTTLPTSPGDPNVNFKMTAATTLDGNLAANTLKLEAPSGDLTLGTNTLTLAGGGLLMTGTTGRSITGTAAPGLTAGSGSGSYDLLVHQYNSGTLTISAVIGDNAGNAVSLVKAGSGTLTLGSNNTYTGNTTINAGAVTHSPLNNTSFGSSTTKVVTIGSGATFIANRIAQTGSQLVMNGGTYRDDNGWGSSWTGAMVLNAHSFFDGTGNAGQVSINGSISGSGGFTRTSLTGAALLLNGTNTYTGQTIITSGVVALGATGSINNSSVVSIAAGATFDVSATTSPYNWSTSTVLRAAGTATAANLKGKSGGIVNLGSQPIVLTYNGLNPALTVSQGTLSLNANPVTVNTASPLALGTYNIVTQTTGSITSTGTYPGVTGTAIGTGKIGSISVSGSNLVLTIGTPTLTVSAFPSPVTAGASNSVTVSLVDSSSNPATAYSGTVHFTSTDGAAVLPSDYTFTSADAGTHTFSGVALKTVGSQSITVTDTVTGAIAGTQSGITVSPAAAAALTVSGFPSAQTSGAPASVTVTAKDAYGNPATAYSGTIHFTSSDGAAVLPANYTFTGGDSGTHTFSGVTLNTVGTSRSITATDTVTGSISGAETGITVTAATVASRLAVTGFPSSRTAGVAGSVTVTAQASNGNTITGYTGTVHFTSNDGAATLPANYTFVSGDNGTHTFASGVTLRTAGSRSITATDTSTAITGTQSGITVGSATATTLTVTGFPSPQFTGAAGDVAVRALDAYGNTATGYGGTVHFTSTDGVASLPSDYTFGGGDNGIHLFTGGVTFNTAGTQAITATDAVTGTITGTQSGITVNLVPSVFTWASGTSGFWDSPASWTNDASIVAAPDYAGKANYVLNFNVAGSFTSTHNLGNGFLLNQMNFGGSTVTLAGFNLTLVNTDVTLPQINQSTAATATVGNNLALNADTTVGVTGSGGLSLNGLISGTGGLTKTGGGTLTMGNATNTYQGPTLVSGGTFTSVLNGRAGFGTGPITLASGAAILFNGPGPNVTNSGTFNGGTITANNGFGAGWSGPVTLNANTAIVANYNMGFGGVVSGVGGLTKSGGGALVLSGLNTYAGNTTISAGTLSLTSSGGLTFAVTDAASNKVTGAGAATFDGHFTIDTTAVTVATGTWTLVDTTTKTFSATFTVVGFTADVDGVTWTKVDAIDPAKTWTFQESTGILTLAATGSGANFGTWASANGVTGGPNGDSDNDGISNLVEYALNLNPNGADGAPGTLTGNLLSFTKRAEAVTNGDVTYAIETSPNLQDPWTTVVPDVNDSTTISYTLPTGAGTVFARLKVTSTAP